ncbi:hypothetical protein K438DRAFT_1999766 [Mycena galopus ATCC 62051]|nr:hypothetical protein K438DRAFT_1999766 [Mycena galopus ATCC 62051]
MREFAQEIIDYVIDFTVPGGIKACGLVCRGWLPRSRYHLFSKLVLTRNNLSAFVDIVDTSPLPILFGYTPAPISSASASKIVPSPIIHTMKSPIWNFFALICSPDSWAAESGSISRLEMALKLVDWPLESLRSILSCVPAIETLHIDGYDMGLFPRSFQGAPVPPFALDHLWHLTIRIDRSGCDDFFTWLITQPPMPLLRLQGGNLEALQFETHLFVESLAFYQDIFQCTTTTLKRVSFTCGHSSHILDIFPLLPPSDWQSIAVSIIAEEEEGTEMDLRTIDAALAGLQFRTLKHFSIRGAEEFNAGLLILD